MTRFYTQQSFTLKATNGKSYTIQQRAIELNEATFSIEGKSPKTEWEYSYKGKTLQLGDDGLYKTPDGKLSFSLNHV